MSPFKVWTVSSCSSTLQARSRDIQIAYGFSPFDASEEGSRLMNGSSLLYANWIMKVHPRLSGGVHSAAVGHDARKRSVASESMAFREVQLCQAIPRLRVVLRRR